jgi:hypothetical protein
MRNESVLLLALSVVFQLAQTLTSDFGNKLYFQPGRDLHFKQLSNVMQDARKAKVFVAHDLGDKGFTAQGFRSVNESISYFHS